MPNKKSFAHPTYEELLLHLEGDCHQESTEQVRQHLESCPECAAELAGWQRTIQKLRACDLPEAPQVPVTANRALLKWAAAAVLILSIGIGLGYSLQPSARQVKREVISELKPQLAQALKEEFVAALKSSNTMPVNSFQEQLRSKLLGALTADEKQALAQEVLQVVQQKQAEQQRAMLALLNQIRSQHQADYLSLRHDLETAAYVADNDLRQNQQQLSQLAATLLAKNQE